MTTKPQAPSTCPAPSTTSPTAHALAELRSGAAVLMPATATTPAEVLATLATGSPIAVDPAAPAAKVLRKVQVSCRCLNHFERNEPAPSAPLALAVYRAAQNEADALDHLSQAACWCNYAQYALGKWADDRHSPAAKGEELDAAMQTALHRLRSLENVAAQHWGVAIAIDHAV